jgi:acetyl-CoA carboxylase biotin carboxyl carrier protein
MDPLTNEDVADILALLDSLPYDEFDLETPRFRLTLRRTPGGWAQSTQILSASESTATATMSHRSGPNRNDVTSLRSSAGTEEAGRTADEAEENGEAGAAPEGAAAEPGAAPEGPLDGDGRGTEDASGGAGDGEHEDAGLVAVRAPLPGTFYRAPRPGAAPFAEVGSWVGADTVIGIVETMKLMNSVPAGVAGVVAEFCVTNAELVAQGAALLRIRAEE